MSKPAAKEVTETEQNPNVGEIEYTEEEVKKYGYKHKHGEASGFATLELAKAAAHRTADQKFEEPKELTPEELKAKQEADAKYGQSQPASELVLRKDAKPAAAPAHAERSRH